jgi:hypothetical protein
MRDSRSDSEARYVDPRSVVRSRRRGYTFCSYPGARLEEAPRLGIEQGTRFAGGPST